MPRPFKVLLAVPGRSAVLVIMRQVPRIGEHVEHDGEHWLVDKVLWRPQESYVDGEVLLRLRAA